MGESNKKKQDKSKKDDSNKSKTKDKKKKFDRRKRKPKSGFKGETSELSDNVFETFDESRDAMQYEKSIKALQVYVASKFRNGGDIVWMLKHEEEFNFIPPSAPRITRSNENTVEQDIYKEQVKMFVSRRERYNENKDKLFPLIWGQCSNSMQSKLQAKTGFHEIDQSRNCLQLIKEIKGVIFNFESQEYPVLSLHHASQKYFNTRQGKDESITEYHKRFRTTVEVLEHYGADIWSHPRLILLEYQREGHTNVTIDNIYRDQALFQKYKRVIKDRAIAYTFIKGAHRDI